MKRFQEKAYDAQRIRLDVNAMMAETIGGAHGITRGEVEALALGEAMDAMEQKRAQMRWRELPHNQADVVKDIQATVEGFLPWCEHFVVLGIGGSALGPIAAHQALKSLRYNELPREKRGGPKLYVEDNVDPERMAALLDVIELEKTVFNVITKSGSTSETMAQLLIVCDLLKKAGLPLSRHVIATTDERKGNLIKIARENGLKTFFVPDGVGGRFSELSPVGLLCACATGVDITALLSGAAYMDGLCKQRNIWKNGAYLLAALQVISMNKGKNISVVMPYADGLKYMADWYAQLWAESLGKRYGDAGEIFAGQTPVKALGVTDQHSQVQLYTEGPFDKVVTFLAVDRYRVDFGIPMGFESVPDVSFLGGHSLNELIEAERVATEYAVTKTGRPNHTITLPELNEFTLGQLMYFFEVETAFAGELMRLNAFDQPGVEEGKNATYALLGKPGFDAKKAELDARAPKLDCYIV